MNRHLLCAGTVLCGIAAGIACGQTTTSMPATAPSTGPATQGAAFVSSDKAGILKAVGTTVTVTGTVREVSTLSSGAITFVNFDGNERGDFTAIIREAHKEAMDKGFGGDVASLQGKKITVTGKVTKYRETPQMELSTPEEVVVVK